MTNNLFYNYEKAKNILLTFAVDDECQSFFEKNNFPLELAYCKLLTGKLIEASVKVFGKEQYAALKEHNRDENGKISTKKMIEEITEILSGMQNGKNS